MGPDQGTFGSVSTQTGDAAISELTMCPGGGMVWQFVYGHARTYITRFTS